MPSYYNVCLKAGSHNAIVIVHYKSKIGSDKMELCELALMIVVYVALPIYSMSNICLFGCCRVFKFERNR
jgi:hypothetical protein